MKITVDEFDSIVEKILIELKKDKRISKDVRDMLKEVFQEMSDVKEDEKEIEFFMTLLIAMIAEQQELLHRYWADIDKFRVKMEKKIEQAQESIDKISDEIINFEPGTQLD